MTARTCTLPGLALVAAILATAFWASTAQAQAPVSTLARIIETGTIRIGYSVDTAPFSYLDADKNIVGYSIDLCVEVADLLRQQLGLDKLAISYVRRSPSDRVMLLKDGAYDIECAASTNNAERRNSVAFTYPHFVTAVQFVSLGTNKLHTIADLEGRTVASTSGTTVIGQLNGVNRDRRLNLAVIPTTNHQMGFDMVTDRRVAAFVMDGIILSTLVANSAEPDLYEISPDPFGKPEPYGLMVRHDDLEFRDAVNTALSQIFTQGDATKIYEKWFTQPIPPHNINLRLPMSDALKSVFRQPAYLPD